MTEDLRSQLQTSLTGYSIERELGGGGMARVFTAIETALGRTVVIKVLSPELAAEVSSKRFAREVRLVASLQQANIVPVLTSGEVNGLPYYTMPFVEGLSLRDKLSAGGAMPIPDAVGVLRDVARALAYAHDRGVVHRDIKPENILLSGHAAVVADFGIAKAISDARTPEAGPQTTTVTQAGTVIGTPAYMAPEQIAADPGIDHRADIYSFGCVAYELLAGESPFAARAGPLPDGTRNRTGLDGSADAKRQRQRGPTFGPGHDGIALPPDRVHEAREFQRQGVGLRGGQRNVLHDFLQARAGPGLPAGTDAHEVAGARG